MLQLILGLVLLWAAPAAADSPHVQRLRDSGCLGCHTLDGGAGKGPTLRGLMGQTRTVREGDATRAVVADAAYVRRSIVDPDAQLVVGYPRSTMPRLPLAPAVVEELVAAVAQAPLLVPLAPPPGSLWPLVLAVLAFVGGHLGLSSVALRGRLVARLGEAGFQIGYSLVVSAAFAGILWAYRGAPYVPLWPAPEWTRWVPLLFMPVALVFIVGGYSTKNPGSAGQASALEQPPQGIVNVTRHPALWGQALWGLAHLPPNGDGRSVLLFGGMTALCLLGMLHIDARRRAACGAAWERFAARTSLVPFAAIWRGATSVTVRQIGLWRILVGLALYGGFLLMHQRVIGMSPWPSS